MLTSWIIRVEEYVDRAVLDVSCLATFGFEEMKGKGDVARSTVRSEVDFAWYWDHGSGSNLSAMSFLASERLSGRHFSASSARTLPPFCYAVH